MLRRAIGDGGDAGGGTFGRDVEGGAGVLGFELFRELRDELGAEGIGAFDDEPLGAGRGREERQSGDES